jgi:hypothetical protein
MANTIKIKRSAVPGKVPTTSDLDLGELGLNTHDGFLFTKRDNGTVSVVRIGGLDEIDGGSSATVFTAGSFTLIDGGNA